MHICHITSAAFPPEEGIGNHIYNISKELIARGHEVTILTRGSWKKTQSDIFDGIQVIKVRFLPIYPFYIHIHGFFVNKIFRSLELQIDIVHIHSPLSPIINTSLPIIATLHTPMLVNSRFIEVDNLRSKATKIMGKFVSYPLEMKLLKRADLVTTVADSVVQELAEYGLNPNEIRVTGNGVDDRLFVPTKKRNMERYILYSGRLGYRKGLFDLVECGTIISNKYPDVSFIIPGKGPLANMLKERVNELGLGNIFKFLGYVERNELIRLYQNATVFIMPSHYESGPLVLVEAMACGVAVVATPVGIVPNLVKHLENGLIIPKKSPEKMAEALSLLLDDEKLRIKLGENARKTVESGWTWDLIAEKLEKCYQSIINL